MTIFEKARRVLRRTLRTQTSQPFVYWSGKDSIAINATLTNPDPLLLIAAGVAMNEAAEHFDLLVDPSEMILLGAVREPVGQELVQFPQGEGLPTRCFMTVQRGNSEFCFKRSDGSEMLWRIYLVEIQQNTAEPVAEDLDVDEDADDDTDG